MRSMELRKLEEEWKMKTTTYIGLLILTVVATAPLVYASVAWNGDEWLIGWEGAIDPTLGRYERSIDLALLREGNVSFVSLGNPASMDRVYWANDYWLITYHPQPRPDTGFARYDGEKLVKLPLIMLLGGIEWNGEYFLIGGDNASHRGWMPVLIKYDGMRMVELASFDESVTVQEIGWNGAYWLIGLSVYNKSEGEPYSRLVKYDGTFTDLWRSSEIVNVEFIEWSGEYWLIAGNDGRGRALIYRYDGVEFADLSQNFREARMIYSILWNGEHWLLGGDRGVLKKYDGISFEDLTLQAAFDVEGSVNTIAWNGEYWLITSRRSPRIKAYDGKSFTDLTPALKEILEHRLLLFGGMGWNGDYWLIQVTAINQRTNKLEYRLIKYDGRFTDLTKAFSKMGPAETEEARQPEKAVCGPTFVTLMALLLLAIKRRWTDRFWGG